MAWVYILRCADGTFYTGSTVDLDRRLEQHRSGFGAVYTRRRLPVTLAWCAEFDQVDEAFAWEKRIQGWSHAKREAFMIGGIDAVKGWSRTHRKRNDPAR
ncbi:GIY-YIG nuclease family protein [Microbacterium sp. SS28]|uniref:GIY-YIG nuclease family protein n=1 Tax=Microbacterium sp. SS28 TaxID=2919948 RepID=UPI001FAAF7BF|nr:GIY-YIG nuclease family protein [Microbacterium sp. SS28]